MALELAELSKRYKNGDIAARDRIFEIYRNKVEKIAQEYYDLGLDNEDVLGYAYEKMLMIIEKCIRKNNSKKITEIYRKQIAHYLSQKILEANHIYYVKEPYLNLDTMIMVLKAKRAYIKRYNREPHIEELSSLTGIDIFRINRIFYRYNKEEYIDLDNIPLEILNHIKNNILDVENAIIYGEQKSVLPNILRNSSLTTQEIEFIKLNYFQEEPLKISEVANRLNLTALETKKLEETIKEKLKAQYTDYFLELAYLKDSSNHANFSGETKGEQTLQIDFKMQGWCKEGTLETLFSAYRNGDIEARDKIFEKYKNKVERLAENYYNLGLANEDVLAYAYLSILETIEHYKYNEDVMNFVKDWKYFVHSCLIRKILEANGIICKISIKSCIGLFEEIMHLKNTNMSKRSLLLKHIQEFVKNSISVSTEDVEEISYDREDIENALIHQELLDNLFSICSFTKQEKNYMQLSYFSDTELSVKDIREILGISSSMLSQLKKRALTKCKTRFSDVFAELARYQEMSEKIQKLVMKK